MQKSVSAKRSLQKKKYINNQTHPIVLEIIFLSQLTDLPTLKKNLLILKTVCSFRMV